MTQTIIQPFLLFFGQAEEAMNFYVSLFPGAKVLDLIRYGPNEPGKEASVKKARFSIGSQIVLCTDSTVKHEFSLQLSPFWSSISPTAKSSNFTMRSPRAAAPPCR
jgi:predicted 3-demethylubiquinone-9 3-methyltransferase (glyoxalase superfamily)